MAILPGFPGLKADILVNGVARREYVDPDSLDEDSPNTVTTYIEAEDDANFAVQFRRDHRFKYQSHELCCTVSLDGKTVSRIAVGNNADPSYGSTVIDASYYNTDNGSFKKKFLFSTLTTCDAPIKTLDQKLLKEIKALGQITIEVHRVVTSGECLQISKTKEVAFATGDISEKALKDDLKAELIIPRSESPVPLENRPLEDLSLEEMRELLKRQRQQIEEAARVKREGRNNVKRERNRDHDSVIDMDNEDVTMLPVKRRRVEAVDLTRDC
ncbi:hypothetical protein FKW77_001479 [Venturia effusa]|uniref:DUF7918 domain-containing protein n=1 Tax=Venturia effusa TaxID=50376 RepID=A0A517LKU1_9PEZI|nr:hypothetical protein FKW77_001479 [Venturia effusa]